MGKQKIEDQTKSLLQKSMLKPASENFDEQLMQKILQSPAHSGSIIKNTYSRKAWIFLTIALLCFLTSSLIIGKFSSGYFKDLDISLSITINYVLYGGLLLFLPLILYHLDNLIQMSLAKTKKELRFT